MCRTSCASARSIAQAVLPPGALFHAEAFALPPCAPKSHLCPLPHLRFADTISLTIPARIAIEIVAHPYSAKALGDRSCPWSTLSPPPAKPKSCWRFVAWTSSTDSLRWMGKTVLDLTEELSAQSSFCKFWPPRYWSTYFGSETKLPMISLSGHNIANAKHRVFERKGPERPALAPREASKSQDIIAIPSLDASVLPCKSLSHNLLWGFPLGALLPKTRVFESCVSRTQTECKHKRLGKAEF